uniref:Uncharacterized protein n=1 Tax=uncultured bacterium contig00088 TaxID=1181561 RepID=A0A806K202_9BACT|nr:hypothetical protein [uncultured bacterium contig00088]
MRKYLTILLAVCLSVQFTGCRGKEGQPETARTGGEITDVSGHQAVQPEETAVLTAAAPPRSEVITVGRVTGDITGDYHFVADDRTDVRIIFSATENVEYFAYIEITHAEDAGGNIALLAGDAIAVFDNLTPGTPVVVAADPGSGIPTRGITFRHEGSVRYFYLSESGFDGSLSLSGFTPGN